MTDWIFDRASELSTTSKTPQLAVSLLDVFHARNTDMDISALQGVGAAALMIAIKVIENFDVTPTYVAQLPDAQVDAQTLTTLESLLLVLTDWSVDLVTASDIIDFLTQILPQRILPQRDQWDAYTSLCYSHPSVRFGPHLIALAGLSVHMRGRDKEQNIKNCIGLMEVAESDVDALVAEVSQFEHTEQTSFESDSTVSSSPDTRRNKRSSE